MYLHQTRPGYGSRGNYRFWPFTKKNWATQWPDHRPIPILCFPHLNFSSFSMESCKSEILPSSRFLADNQSASLLWWITPSMFFVVIYSRPLKKMGISPTIWWLAIFWGIWWSDIIIIWQTTWYGFGGLDPRNCCFDVWKNDERDLGVQSFRTNPYDRCTFVFHDDQRLASCGLFYTKVRLGYKLLTSPIRFHFAHVFSGNLSINPFAVSWIFVSNRTECIGHLSVCWRRNKQIWYNVCMQGRSTRFPQDWGAIDMTIDYN